MAKRTTKPTTGGAREATVDVADAAGTTGSNNPAFQSQLLRQVANTLSLPVDASDEGHIAAANAAIAALKGIAPRDELEGMLAVQMVSTHNAAMACLKRRMQPEQFLDARDQYLKHAAKLLAVYTRQMEALAKHRGKGRQKITVEHVNVHDGGQAIVGNVDTGATKAGSSASSPVLENNNDPLMPPLEVTRDIKPKTKAGAE